VLKNLIAHRERNKKTSMMYAMSLSFIIMINVFSFIQLQSFEFYLRQSRGSSFVIFGTQKTPLSVNNNVLRYKDFLAFSILLTNNSATQRYVKNVGWSTVPINRLVNDLSCKISNHGKIFGISDVQIMATSPNYLQVAEPTFLSVLDEWSWIGKLYSKKLNIIEELYTPYGSQTTILPSSYENNLFLSTNIENGNAFDESKSPNPISLEINLLKYVNHINAKPYAKVYSLLPSYMLNNAAGLRMNRFQASNQNVLVSLPEYLALTNGIVESIEDIPIGKIVVMLETNLATDEIDTIAKTVSSAIGKNNVQGRIFNLNDRLRQIESIVTTINYFFAALTVVGMTLCFFSLLASMIANITEQTKDIAILRSLGLTQSDIIQTFVLEASVLVIASSLLGSVAGYLVAWTISSQRALITQVPVSGYFPVDTAILIISLALMFGVLSAGFPAKMYARKYIANLLRL
jgi:ABC-type antimicrobial peptide transport system permease subunit